MKWGDIANSNLRYDFSYESNNRLIESNFHNSSSFDVAYQYNNNGNIVSLLRKGNYGVEIDDLEYHYTGNQLNYMIDYEEDVAGIVDYPESQTEGDHFDYDHNGNMIYEPDKNINILYNRQIR